VPLDSAVITVAPVIGLVLGLVLALKAPFGRPKTASTPAEPPAA